MTMAVAVFGIKDGVETVEVYGEIIDSYILRFS